MDNTSNKIAEWIHVGESLIPKEKYNRWETIVRKLADSIYEGDEIVAIIELLKLANDGKKDDEIRNAFFRQGHSGASASMVQKLWDEFGPKRIVFIGESRPLTNEEFKKNKKKYI